MIENESIYIKCLRKGYECRQSGITYWEMVDYLTPFGIPAKEYDFHVYFFKWFFDNFHQQIVTDSRIRELKIVFDPRWMNRDVALGGNPQLDMKAMMTFEAQEKYLNYLLLTESDRKAKRANTLSWWAVGLTALSLICQTGISLFQTNKCDEPQAECKNLTQKDTTYLKLSTRTHNDTNCTDTLKTDK